MLTVMTLNAANYNDHKNWEIRRQIIVNTILKYNVDLIALQEIRFDASQESTKITYENMGEQILSQLSDQGYQGSIVYQWAQYYDPTTRNPVQTITTCWEGLAIISHTSLVETGSVFLSSTNCSDGNHRITEYASIQKDTGMFYLFNTHFAMYEECLPANIKETVAYMEQFNTSPRLLVGDMNATPDNPDIQTLAKLGFTDVWAMLQPGKPGYTYPSDNPVKRIDYCWADKNAVGSCKGIELVCTDPQSGIYASDHFGLLVTLSI